MEYFDTKNNFQHNEMGSKGSPKVEKISKIGLLSPQTESYRKQYFPNIVIPIGITISKS